MQIQCGSNFFIQSQTTPSNFINTLWKKSNFKTYQNYLKYLKAGSQISFNQARNHHKKLWPQLQTEWVECLSLG